MKGILLATLFSLASLLVYSQDAERNSSLLISVNVGHNSYQELPSAFQLNSSADAYSVTNLQSSLIFAGGVSWVPEGLKFQYGLTFSYESALSDLQEGTSTYANAFSVQHYTFLAHFKWDYCRTRNELFSIGGGLYLGLGTDVATFSEDVPEFDYTQTDYHYHLDPLSIRVGKSYGIEASVGYGVLGVVRGGFFYSF